MQADLSKPQHYYHPKNWGIFFAKMLLWLVSKLPYRMMLGVGIGFGQFISHFNSKNNRIIMRNLELCFPKQNKKQHKILAKQCWQSHVIAAFEAAMGWWGSQKRLKKLLHVKGEQHLHAALGSCKGLMLITAHFTSLELQGVMLSLLTKYSSTAKHLRNPVADYELNKARRRHLQTTLFPEDLKQVHRRLQQGEVITFLLDQDYGPKGSVFAPFFNIATATTNAMPRIAKKTNSIVIPMFFFRLANGKGYQLEFQPALEHYPSDNPIVDATRFNQAVEQAVRRYPEQYGWTYKRFATRPIGEKKIYP